MEHLWTPWRYQYLRAAREDQPCIFCALQKERQDRDNLILLRQERTFLVLNRYPYTSGHLLVVLNRHVPTLRQTRLSELREMVLLARRCEAVLQQVYQPDGFNIGFNIGKSAGAGVAGHLHLHVVPRWHGDANFVAVLGETRVIPEDLGSTYAKLLPHFAPGAAKT